MLLLSLLTNIPTIAACVTFKLIATEYRTQAAVSPCNRYQAWRVLEEGVKRCFRYRSSASCAPLSSCNPSPFLTPLPSWQISCTQHFSG